MVIFEGLLSHRAFGDKVELSHERFDRITLGLGKGGAITLAVYFAIKIMGIAHENEWNLLLTPYGQWFLVELLGFVALPGFLFALGYRDKKTWIIRTAAVITVLGIVLNRLNISVFAFNWQLPPSQRYLPGWMEIWVTLSLVVAGVVAFRWIANRMPILRKHPEYDDDH
jgi:hypothetical protein